MVELGIVLIFCALLAWREWANARERAELVQRIQAPTAAIARHEREASPERKPLPVIGLEDDERMKLLREERERGGD